MGFEARRIAANALPDVPGSRRGNVRALDAPRDGDSRPSPARDPQGERERLDALRVTVTEATEFVTRLVEPIGSPVIYLRVINPSGGRLAEDVGCQPVPGGELAFVWSWGEVICPAGDTATAVAALQRVISEG